MLPGQFVILGTLLGAVATVGYLLDTLRGRVRPNRVSFTLWAAAPAIAFLAEIKQGVGLIAFQTLAQAVLPLLVVAASFVNKQAEWRLTVFDVSCGALSVLGLVLWSYTGTGNVAIIFSILADGLASLPVIVKAYRFPETEVAWPWSLAALGMLVGLLSIQDWTFANYGFVLYLFANYLLITLFVRFRPHSRSGVRQQGV